MTVRPGPVDLSVVDDRTLAGRSADGDAIAFAEIVRRHTPVMRAYARKILGRTDEVDDTVQDTFIQAWDRMEQLNNPAALRSWLLRILSYKSIDRIRARRDHSDIADHEAQAPPEQAPDQVSYSRSRNDALRQVLERLPNQQRQCWTLKELGGFSYIEIAEAMGLPVSTVRGLLARARINISREMEEWK